MKVSKIEALEDYKNKLQDCLNEINDESNVEYDEAMATMIEVIDIIDLKLKEAKRIIAEIRKL